MLDLRYLRRKDATGYTVEPFVSRIRVPACGMLTDARNMGGANPVIL